MGHPGLQSGTAPGGLALRPEAVLDLRSSGGGARVLVRMADGVELEASRGATPKLKERLGIE